jgi:hypothetical protein
MGGRHVTVLYATMIALPSMCAADVLVWAPGLGAGQLPPQAGIPFGTGEDVFLLNAQ